MTSVEDLEQARQRLTDLLRGVRADLGRAKRRAEVQARAWVLPPHERRVVVAMYHIADLDAEPVVKYLSACGRERGWKSLTAADLRALVEEHYLAAEHEEIAALVDDANPLDEAVLAIALKYVNEWRVVVSARISNSTTGVVPTCALLQHAEELRQAVPEAMRPPPLGAATERRARRWAGRLRARWGGRFGRVPVAEHVDVAELFAKAIPYHTAGP